jgi:hypothetical protein
MQILFSTRVLFHFHGQEARRKIGGSQDLKPARQAMIQLKATGSPLPPLYKLDSLPNVTLYCPMLGSVSESRTAVHGKLQQITAIHQFSVITVLNTSDEVLPLAWARNGICELAFTGTAELAQKTMANYLYSKNQFVFVTHKQCFC